MTTSLLHRLPDIVALARARARDLLAPPRAAPPRSSHPHGPAPMATDAVARRVTLLCGDGLAVMLGLVAGQGRDWSLAGQVPLIWLDASPHTAPTAADGDAAPALQHRMRHLLEFAVRLFVARELLTRDGLLATPLPFDPEHCAERLLITVFGQSRALVAPVRPLHGAPQGGVCVAGRTPDRHLPPMGGPDLLFDLALHATRSRDPVLVLPASPACAGWVAALDRRWLLVQPDAGSFALLKEQVIARQMGLPGAVPARESARQWASAL